MPGKMTSIVPSAWLRKQLAQAQALYDEALEAKEGAVVARERLKSALDKRDSHENREALLAGERHLKHAGDAEQKANKRLRAAEDIQE